MSASKLLSSALESLAALFVLYLTHRLLSLSALSPTELTPLLRAQALTVGILSDLWVATLVATLILLGSALLAALGLPQVARVCRLGVLLLSAIGVGAHQAYVDFYHAQIIPFHLRYLMDPDFLTANGLSLLGLKPFVVFLSMGVTLAILVMGDFLRDRSLRHLATAATAIFFVALVGHNRNIHWRVQWFVHDNLQVNVAERLYLQAKSSDLPDPLTQDEARHLASAVAADAPTSERTPTADDLLRLITKPAIDTLEVRSVGKSIKSRFQAAQAAGRRPMILVVLLESLRPSETGYFAPGRAPSLTPHLDQVAASGIFFTQAYSTGSVTRGAQEAVFCGYLGSRDTSLMRGQTAVRLPCLPELVNAGDRASTDTFWFHGGEGRFDNQVDFWSAHGIAHVMAMKDFPPDAPRTGWGVGDATFFKATAQRLEELKRSSTSTSLMGMALSISNHIPWTMPTDLPQFAAPEGLSHQSYVTTAYADAALGDFLAELKRRLLWTDTLLILASDHGNNVPPYVDLYEGSTVKQPLLQSHINLLLSGGLVDAALADEALPNLMIEDPVSQADIAALVAYVKDVHGARFMGENPLGAARHLPVLATLEQDVFDPRAMRAYSRRVAARSAPVDTPADELRTLLFFRAFLQYTYTWGSARP